MNKLEVLDFILTYKVVILFALMALMMLLGLPYVVMDGDGPVPFPASSGG